MGPDEVHEILREERVVGPGQPGRHHFTPILAGQVGRVAAEKLWRDHPAADGMLHIPSAGIEDDRLTGILAGLAPDLGEEVGEAVVIIHRPTVERMIVALGALDPHPHENLGDVFGDFQRIRFVLVVVRRGARERPSLGREEIPHQLVDGDVPLDLLLEPVVVEEHRLVADLLRGADHEQLRPLHHPHLDELLPLEERVDEVLALGRIGAREERLQFVGRRERAADVEADAADEFVVAAQL